MNVYSLNSYQGQLSYKDGSIYNGFFLDGKKHGTGLILYINGDKYEGNFCGDEINGQGEFIYFSGREEKGIWKNGKLKENQQQIGIKKAGKIFIKLFV